MIDPKLLCNNHLLGEHGEIHKHRHVFVKKYSIAGRIEPKVQIEPESMHERHEQLAKEMVRRKIKHQSPYVQPDLSYLKPKHRFAKVNTEISISDLSSRCENCRANLIN